MDAKSFSFLLMGLNYLNINLYIDIFSKSYVTVLMHAVNKVIKIIGRKYIGRWSFILQICLCFYRQKLVLDR